MWDQIQGWTTNNFIFCAVIVVLLCLIIFPNRFRQIFKRFRKIKAGPTGIELDTGEDDISPETPCPYTKSRDVTFNAIRTVDEKVNGLTKEVQEIVAIVKNMSIDQQKQLFYDKNQPNAERLAGGLKYLCQGGNGLTKKDVVIFAEQNKEIYNALTLANPKLRIIYQEGGTP